MFAKRFKPKPIKIPCLYSHLTNENRYLVREEYIKRQYNVCYHCECALDDEPSDEMSALDINSDLFPENFFDNPIHLHHDHDTDLTIGAVHAHCNAVLWQYEGV